MNRREVLGSLFAGAVTPLTSSTVRSSGARPNILFLMTDEHRFDCVGYVNPVVKTPHLDRLAGQSVVFTHAYSTSPSCVPARAAIYTGRYPSQCGAPAYITYLPDTETTYMSRLRKAGYYTAAIGKQHFGATGIDRGYDYEDIIDLVGEGPEANSYLRFLREAGQSEKRLATRAGRFSSRWMGEQRFHVDDFIGEQAKRWFKKPRPTGKPWYLTVSFHGPHQPFNGLGLSYEKQYRPEGINLPATNSSHLADKPPHFGDLKQRSVGITEDEIRQTRISYYSKISMIDSKIGDIVDALKVSGEFDNTLIIFSVDHGDFMGDFGLMTKGQYLSEVLMRIPLLVKPAVAGYPGRREDAFVCNFDIAPTCLSIAGVPIPPDMAAEDLSKFWVSPGAAKQRPLCFMDGQGLQGVRDERWKLIHYRDRAYGELYDLSNDPWEKKNLWDDPSARAAKAALQNHLVDHLIGITPRANVEWNRGAVKI